MSLFESDENMNKVELLAPAGDLEKLEIAIHYGADAVYLAGKQFSLRNFSGNFNPDELFHAVSLAHKHNIKVYVACNAFVRNSDFPEVGQYLLDIGKAEPDGIIIADPGVIKLALQHIPQIPVHLSTQANTTNFQSALFWKSIGVKRINTARELPLTDIRSISEDSGLEIEVFVHGAMCMAYSGRCLLSNYMTGRDANQGMCAHPCRYRYAVVEETRAGEYMPLMEDDQGAYIFSSKDLCMIDHIPELIRSKIHSLKIEGRMKGIHYLATVIKAYREAVDAYYRDPEHYTVNQEWKSELEIINHRGYCTGFYFGEPNQLLSNYRKSHDFLEHRFMGKILGHETSGLHQVNVRNKLTANDMVEVISPSGPPVQDRITRILNANGDVMETAQPGTRVLIQFSNHHSINGIVRKITTTDEHGRSVGTRPVQSEQGKKFVNCR